jgi:hypothetical protein
MSGMLDKILKGTVLILTKTNNELYQCGRYNTGCGKLTFFFEYEMPYKKGS